MIPQKIHENQKEMVSTDMYLKSIYEFENYHNMKAKPVNITKLLGISKSSVSEMIKKLEDEKYLKYESYCDISLTKKGLKRAKTVSKKYTIIKQFLIKTLDIKPDKASIEACILEHAFSNSSVKKIKEFLG